MDLNLLMINIVGVLYSCFLKTYNCMVEILMLGVPLKTLYSLTKMVQGFKKI